MGQDFVPESVVMGKSSVIDFSSASGSTSLYGTGFVYLSLLFFIFIY